MQEVAENPYAASTVDSEPSFHVRPPIGVYGYSFVVFFLGAFAGGFTSWPLVYLGLANLHSFAIVGAISSVCGLFAASRMYRKLADIHRRRVIWQMEQAERLGEFY